MFVKHCAPNHIGLVKLNFERKIVNIFLPSVLTYVFGAPKNRLIETVLLSTHNICCFGAPQNRLIEMVLLSTNNICFG